MNERYISRSDSKQRTQSTSGNPMHTQPNNYFTQARINSFSHSLHELQTGAMQFKRNVASSTRNLKTHGVSNSNEIPQGPFQARSGSNTTAGGQGKA